MPALDTSKAEEISVDTQKIEIGVSIMSLLVNLVNFLVIRQKFKTILVYQVQQIDSLVTAVGQIGFIIILFQNISDAPNASMCGMASALVMNSVLHFLLSNLLMVTGK